MILPLEQIPEDDRVSSDHRVVHVRQLLAEILVFYHRRASTLRPVFAGTLEVTVASLVMAVPASLLPPVHEEEDEAPQGDAEEGEVEASLVVCHVCVHIAGYRKTDQDRKRPDTLNKTPAPWKMLGPNPLKSIDFENVVKAAKEDTVEPNKEEVAVITLQGAESKGRESDAEDGGL